MELRIERKWKKEKYTVGRLYVDDVFFSNTLEDTDRNLCEGMSEEYILQHKKYGETAIPRGRYSITLDVQSPKYSKKKYYKDFCDGYLPRLLDVKGFEGILIHPLNKPEESLGCIGVGMNTQVGMITESRKYFEKLYLMLKEAVGRGEKIWITID